MVARPEYSKGVLSDATPSGVLRRATKSISMSRHTYDETQDLGGIIHTYQKFDPAEFPSPTAPPPDLVSPALSICSTTATCAA